jgi:hypothetical protein
MSEADLGRCSDCLYKVSIHVASDGRFLGCPIRLTSPLGQDDLLPRITVRVGKSGARKGKVFVTWPDHSDPDSKLIIVWDMGTGEHYTDDQERFQEATRRADRDHALQVKEEIEYQIGGKVRVISGNWGRS